MTALRRTALHRLRVLTVIGTAVVTTGTATACDSAPATPAASSPTVTAGATESAPAGSATTGAAPAPTGSAAGTSGSVSAVACTAADLAPTLTNQPDRASGTTRMALLQLTNSSDHPCRLRGWATVTLFDAANQPVRVPTSTVAQPGPAVPVDLPAGSTASAGIKWTACDKGDPNCPTGNGMRVGLPGAATVRAAELSGFPSAEKSDITMKTLQIGSIQPSTQGVVAW